MIQQNARAMKARELRYKKSALASMGADTMRQEMYDIQEACGDVAWFFAGDNGENLVAAMDGDEDEAWEFKMLFSDLSAKAEQLVNTMGENDVEANFDDCLSALIGNRFDMVGYDSYEEDYYSLTQRWAVYRGPGQKRENDFRA